MHCRLGDTELCIPSSTARAIVSTAAALLALPAAAPQGIESCHAVTGLARSAASCYDRPLPSQLACCHAKFSVHGTNNVCHASCVRLALWWPTHPLLQGLPLYAMARVALVLSWPPQCMVLMMHVLFAVHYVMHAVCVVNSHRPAAWCCPHGKVHRCAGHCNISNMVQVGAMQASATPLT